MKTRKSIFILIALALAFAGCKTTDSAGQRIYKPELVQHIKGSAFKATERGYYTAELVTKPRQPVVGKMSAQLIIHDYKAVDRPGLDIEATLYMPDEGAFMDSDITVKDAGRGLYLLDFEISKPGKCEMHITISGPEETDKVELELPEVKL